MSKKPRFGDLSPIGVQLIAAAHKTDTHYFTIERVTVQPGKTFSREAMDNLFDTMEAWVEARVITRWEETGEPPTVMRVSVTVNAQ
jgi:hypothetical protein